MLAVRCHSHGPPENLSLDDIDKPSAGEKEALVEIYAASLNFPDGLQIHGKYQFQPDMPFTPGAGADVIYDPVGGDLFDQCCRCINWNGRLLVIGFTSGRIPAYKANLALLKGSSMVGVFLGRFRQEEPETYERNFRELLEMYGQGKIKPLITQKYPLEDYVSAFNVFTERRALGKVILEMKSE